MRNKVLNFFLSIIVILIVVIFSVVYYYMYNNKAEISVYNELLTIENNLVEKQLEIEQTSIEDIQVLNIESSQIQKIYPFTFKIPIFLQVSILISKYFFSDTSCTGFYSFVAVWLNSSA